MYDYEILGESGYDTWSVSVIEITENCVCVTCLLNLTCYLIVLRRRSLYCITDYCNITQSAWTHTSLNPICV